MRRALVALALLAVTLGCAARPSQPSQPAPIAPASATAPAAEQSSTPTAPASTSPAPKPLTMPNVTGENAAVALDQLQKLGFTNVQLGTVDGHAFVALPQNWTVKTQSAKAGTQVMSDAVVVLGCAKNQ